MENAPLTKTYAASQGKVYVGRSKITSEKETPVAKKRRDRQISRLSAENLDRAQNLTMDELHHCLCDSITRWIQDVDKRTQNCARPPWSSAPCASMRTHVSPVIELYEGHLSVDQSQTRITSAGIGIAAGLQYNNDLTEDHGVFPMDSEENDMAHVDKRLRNMIQIGRPKFSRAEAPSESGLLNSKREFVIRGMGCDAEGDNAHKFPVFLTPCMPEPLSGYTRPSFSAISDDGYLSRRQELRFDT